MGDGHVGEDQDEALEPRLSAQSLPVDQDAGRELTLWSSSPCEDLDEAAELRPCAPEHRLSAQSLPVDQDAGTELTLWSSSPCEAAELRPCAPSPPEDQDERADEPQPPLCLAEDEEVAAELRSCFPCRVDMDGAAGLRSQSPSVNWEG